MKKLMAAASGSNMLLPPAWDNGSPDEDIPTIRGGVRRQAGSGFWEFLVDVGELLLKTTVKVLKNLPEINIPPDSYQTDSSYFKPRNYQGYPQQQWRNRQGPRQAKGFSAELFNQIMRDANQDNSFAYDANLSFVEAPPSGSQENQNPPIMGQGSNYYSGERSQTKTGNYSQGLGFSDPDIVNKYPSNSYDYDLERARELDAQLRQQAQQNPAKTAGERAGQKIAQNAVAYKRSKTLKEVAKEIHAAGDSMSKQAAQNRQTAYPARSFASLPATKYDAHPSNHGWNTSYRVFDVRSGRYLGELEQGGQGYSKAINPYRVFDVRAGKYQDELDRGGWELGKNVTSFLLDDFITLNNPKATWAEKAIAAGNIGLTFIPGGRIPEQLLKFPALARVEKYGKHLITVSSKNKETLTKLTEAGFSKPHIDNYKRFFKQVAKPSRDIEIYKLKDGKILFQSAKEADSIPNSYTVYQKRINQLGDTEIFGHATYDKSNNFIHFKEKFPVDGNMIRNKKNYEQHLF